MVRTVSSIVLLDVTSVAAAMATETFSSSSSVEDAAG
jgi:hypothetical protein